MVKKASVTAARAEYYRLKHLPRPEEIPLKVAAVKDAAARLADSKRKLKQVEAAFQQAEADANQIEADLKRRTIVASVSGEVLQVNVRPGSTSERRRTRRWC